MHAYLAASRHIDHHHPLIRAQAAALADGCATPEAVVARCFTFVRDAIKHSGDYHRDARPSPALNPLTCTASDVLRHGTGYCYAKSHLLAALLRANAIPTGLCYQRLAAGEAGAPFCLHGLNAVFLPPYGWYRVDARGNKPGVAAAFTPPVEQLAFPIRSNEERDLPEIWPEPLPLVVDALTGMGTVENLLAHLPDIALIA
jgi:transglutaminase-like putative cysteine protease